LGSILAFIFPLPGNGRDLAATVVAIFVQRVF